MAAYNSEKRVLALLMAEQNSPTVDVLAPMANSLQQFADITLAELPNELPFMVVHSAFDRYNTRW